MGLSPFRAVRFRNRKKNPAFMREFRFKCWIKVDCAFSFTLNRLAKARDGSAVRFVAETADRKATLPNQSLLSQALKKTLTVTKKHLFMSRCSLSSCKCTVRDE